MNFGDVGQQYGGAVFTEANRDGTQIVLALNIARCADHIFSFGHFDDAATGFLIAALNCHPNMRKRYAVGAQTVRVSDNLILAHHAANRGDFGNALYGLQFVAQEPILDAA